MAHIVKGPEDNLIPDTFRENDTIDGGLGNDTVSYAESGGGGAGLGVTVGVFVDLSNGTGTDFNDDFTMQFDDQLISIENVIGSSFDDAITGDVNANVLDGGDGGDALFA